MMENTDFQFVYEETSILCIHRVSLPQVSVCRDYKDRRYIGSLYHTHQPLLILCNSYCIKHWEPVLLIRL
jgi:hypothetical protein